MRLQEYIKNLQVIRSKEVVKKDPIIGKGDSFSSPTGATPTEEIRLFNEYKEQDNLFRITEAFPEKKKAFILKRFFKMKRNQQVEIYSDAGNEKYKHTIGKVSVAGRDFVMVTNLKDRIWIPYQVITSANIPTGIPNYSNSHQYYIFDNNLRHKLTTDFGRTVSKREELIQQFYEETLNTNLITWKSSWVKVETSTEVTFGRISEIQNNRLIVHTMRGKHEIPIEEILYIQSLRVLSILSMFNKKSPL